MKKFQRLFCNTCNRTTDKPLDNVRFTSDKCTITLACEGRLSPIENISKPEITGTPPIGVQDWRPRASHIQQNAQNENMVFVNAFTGIKNQLTCAVLLSGDIPDNLQVKLRAKKASPKEFRSYVFRFDSPFSTVVGLESGLERKTLRYDVSEIVEVFVNGVKLTRGSGPGQYLLFGDGDVPPNTIQLPSGISTIGTTQVDITISALDSDDVQTLTFVKSQYEEDRVSAGAWENVNAVSKLGPDGWKMYQVYRHDITPELKLNCLYVIDSVSYQIAGVPTQVPLEDIFLLLARQPFSPLDRYSNIIIPFSNMGFDSGWYFKYTLVDNISTFEASQSQINTVFPALRMIKFNKELTIKTALSGVDGQVVIDGNKIIGPDA
jgi:hypothetical protein